MGATAVVTLLLFVFPSLVFDPAGVAAASLFAG
jgi:hypothetical protein